MSKTLPRTTTCDFCDTRFPVSERRVVALPRPSDPSELVAVMWGCGSCEHSRDLPTPVEIEQQVESGEREGIAFVTV